MKRQKLKEKTKKRILEIAYELFCKRGILATSTLEIAQEAEVSHGSVFHHFPTRESLVTQVIDQFARDLSHELHQTNSSSLRDCLISHLRILERYELFYARLITEGPLMSQEIHTQTFLIQCGIAGYFQKAAGKTASPLLLNSWLGLIHYYLANRDLFAPGQSVIATKGRELIEYFLKNNGESL